MSMPYSVPLRVSRSGGEKGKSRASDDVSSVRHTATALSPRGRVDRMPSRWRKARGSSLPRVAAKCPLARWVISLRDASSFAWRVTEERGVKQPLPSPLHLVAQAGHVLQGDLRLRGHGAPPLEGQRLRRLEAHLLPLQRPGRLLCGDRPQVDGQVHRRSRRHEALEEAGGQGAGPLAQVEGADQAVSDPHLAPAHLHLHRRFLVHLGGRAAQGRGQHQHPQTPAAQGMDGQTGPRQQAAQLVEPPELAHGVEAPVEDAVAGLQLGQEPAKGLGRRLGLRRQVARLGLRELVPQPAKARRVLTDEELHGEVAGVERPGEGPQLRLVKLKPHHLAHAQFYPVQADGAVVVQVGEHVEEGQFGRRLGSGSLGFRGFGGRIRVGLRNVLRSG